MLCWSRSRIILITSERSLRELRLRYDYLNVWSTFLVVAFSRACKTGHVSMHYTNDVTGSES